MKLYKLLESIEIIQSWNTKDMDINRLAYHSKKIKQGDLFVCIKGYEMDGHKYIMQAIANGALAIIVEDYQEGWDIPQFQVRDSRKALAALSDAYFNYPSQSMKMIGITATNGKTTTSFMTNSILESHNLNTGLIGTVKVKYGQYVEPAILTTPESLDLHRHFCEMVRHNVSHTTMEVSSSALELKRVGNVDFDIVTLNNITREHIDLHGSFEEYYNSKAALIRNAKPDAWAILNLDDPYSASLADETAAQVLTFGIENQEGHLVCKNLDLSTGRAKFTVEIQKPFAVGNTIYTTRKFNINLSVPGYHSVYNSMVAIAIALLCEVPVPTIVRALHSFSGVERRFQSLFEGDFKLYDDHFANTGNINVTLETLNLMDYNKLHMVYAIRGCRGVTTNRENAEAIVSWAKKLNMKEIVASLSKSHVSPKDEVMPEELKVFQEVMDNAGIKVHLYHELPHAINHSLSKVEKDDVVLLAGCQGMDYGGKIALEQLYQLRPHLDKDTLFKPLEHRVAGME